MNIENLIASSLDKSKEVISDSLDRKDFRESLKIASELIIDTYSNKGKVILAGNGGSALIVSIYVQSLLVDLISIDHLSLLCSYW